jgi:hypothetical protein
LLAAVERVERPVEVCVKLKEACLAGPSRVGKVAAVEPWRWQGASAWRRRTQARSGRKPKRPISAASRVADRTAEPASDTAISTGGTATGA